MILLHCIRVYWIFFFFFFFSVCLHAKRDLFGDKVNDGNPFNAHTITYGNKLPLDNSYNDIHGFWGFGCYGEVVLISDSPVAPLLLVQWNP